MNDVPARLIIKRGPNPEQEYSLTLVEVTIGRSSTNVIAIADPEVSRRHACIRWDDGSYIIEDWASTNGTFVNDRQISGPIALYNGDEIRLGETILLQFLDNHENFQPGTDSQYADATDAVTVVESAPQVWSVESKQEAVLSNPAEELPSEQFILPEQGVDRGSCRRWVLGCGCGFLVIVFLCMSTVYFLDAYQQGRLLYCGPLRPFFEIIFGPFGFAPICS
jgi:hypothetical protein